MLIVEVSVQNVEVSVQNVEVSVHEQPSYRCFMSKHKNAS